MGSYKDAMRKLSQATKWEFSADSQPKMAMPIVTKIERVQPYVAGLDARGEFKWEGREMPRWQMEMFRIARDLFHFITRTEWGSRWYELANYETKDRAQDSADQAHFYQKEETQERLNEMRRMYPRKKNAKKLWRHTGD